MSEQTKPRIVVFSLAWYPFESGGESAPRIFIDKLADRYDFDVITYRFDRAWSKKEQIGGATVYRVGGLNKYDWMFRAFIKASLLHRRHRFHAAWSIMAAYAGGVAYWFKRFHSRVPLVLTLQEGDPIEHIMRQAGVTRPWFRDLFRRADAVQAISRYLAHLAQELGFAGEPVVVPNGIELSAFNIQRITAAFPKQKDTIVLINTSRLVHKNAHDIIIRALAYLPEHVVYKNVAQQGDLLSYLTALAKKEGVAHRVFLETGLPLDQIPKWLCCGDIFVRPSRSEGLGTSFIEAMAAGLPIVATPVGGIPDLLTDGVTGLFAHVDDPKSVAACVQRLIGDASLRERITREGRAKAKHYDWNDLAQQMGKIFDTVLTHVENA